MSGKDPASPIDFTISDNEDICSQASLKASLKRRPSDSSMEDMIDHDQLQASIEDDVLGGFRVHPSWSFRKISSQPKSITSSFLQDSSTISTTSSQAALNNEFPFNGKLARTRETKQATSSMRTTLMKGQGLTRQTLEVSQNDYLDDEGLEAFLRSIAPSTSEIETQIELPPDTEKEMIELEMEEVVEAVDEEDDDEDEASNEFMNVIAVDETNQDLMSIIEISSDEEGHIIKERRKQQSPSRPRRESIQSSIRNVRLEPNIRLGPNIRPGPNIRLGPNIRVGPNVRLQEIKHGDYTYTLGQGVEFYNGTFMRINSISRGHQGDVTFSGPLLIRHLHHVLDPRQPKSTRLFPCRQNEVIWTVTIDGTTPQIEKDFVQRGLSEAMRPREIVFTNQSWPCMSSQAYTGGRQRGSSLLNKGTLFCRWKRVKQIEIKHAHQDYEESIERLTEKEADTAYSIKSSKLRFASRRQHVKADGGSATYARKSVAVDGSTKKVPQYSFADCFCGCGGASRGAELAGLAVQWAIDADQKAAQSYRANFRSTACYREDISDLLSRLGEPGATAAFMVDVLHISPPCQAFSPARTRGCLTKKEHLEALILSVGDLLKSVKPRIATMEETAGLLTRHKDWAAQVIRSMIDNGYGVRWKIIGCQTLGVPQVRKRVVIIAAGPGEVLPPFPKPTHGPASALKRRLATIHDAISNIPPRATHNRAVPRFNKEPFSPHTQAKTITCSGGDNYHPSGLRLYTAREMACLQTFPFLHSFGNANLTTARKQIGNAYPPAVARAVFRAIVQSLKETDGVQ